MTDIGYYIGSRWMENVRQIETNKNIQRNKERKEEVNKCVEKEIIRKNERGKNEIKKAVGVPRLIDVYKQRANGTQSE
jgi:hypothetical protein